MVRTKADGGARKAVAAKAPRKVLVSSTPSASSSSMSSPRSDKYSGGNTVCARPTPEWQKGISSFFQGPQTSKENTPPETDSIAGEKSSVPTESAVSAQSDSQRSDTSTASSNASSGPQRNGVIDSDSDDDY